MYEGICLACGKTVDGKDINREVFPAIHRECGGEVAVHIDLGERIKERLEEPHPVFPPEFGPTGDELWKLIAPRRKWKTRQAVAEEIQVFNTLYGVPFECPCGETSKVEERCVHCGRPNVEYVRGDDDGE